MTDHTHKFEWDGDGPQDGGVDAVFYRAHCRKENCNAEIRQVFTFDHFEDEEGNDLGDTSPID